MCFCECRYSRSESLAWACLSSLVLILVMPVLIASFLSEFSACFIRSIGIVLGVFHHFTVFTSSVTLSTVWDNNYWTIVYQQSNWKCFWRINNLVRLKSSVNSYWSEPISRLQWVNSIKISISSDLGHANSITWRCHFRSKHFRTSFIPCLTINL